MGSEIPFWNLECRKEFATSRRKCKKKKRRRKYLCTKLGIKIPKKIQKEKRPRRVPALFRLLLKEKLTSLHIPSLEVFFRKNVHTRIEIVFSAH